jgi:hypothetical protein
MKYCSVIFSEGLGKIIKTRISIDGLWADFELETF